jgi:CBS domain-containing protein
MRCEEIMKRDIECVSPQDTAQLAARKMRDENIGFLPVCDSAMRALGTITDRDLAIRLVADDLAPTIAIQEIMTNEVVACRPEDDLRKAEQLMGEHHKSRILCIDGSGKLAGLISLSDIAQKEEPTQVTRVLCEVASREAYV